MQNEAKGKSPDELNDKPFLDDKNFHLAGIIPVAGHKINFGMEWDESLAPISPNYTLIENAVYECAWAGCDTIWIVCNDDVAPVVRYRIGDYIQDPLYFYNTLGPKPSSLRRRIPIFWVPVFIFHNLIKFVYFRK